MQNKPNLITFLIIFFVVVAIQNMLINTGSQKKVSYDEFKTLLENKKIQEVVITDSEMRGASSDAADKIKLYSTNIVDDSLIKELSPYNVKYQKIVENTFFKDILSWVIPPLIFVLIWLFFMKKMAERSGMGGGSLMSVGKSKAKVYVEKNTGVNFNDVAGVDEAKQELLEIVNFLKDSETYGKLGGRMPKGVLLVGPPGTGKTLLAKAVAGEAKVPFFSISGSEFVEMFVGVGAARVRDLFEQARKTSPCIIFIDELDALGKARSSVSMHGGNDEKEQTLNQLLTEMDGFDTKEGIILLAATNRPEILDPALLRAGRFDRQVLVDRPDKKGRIDILKVHTKKVKLQAGTDLEQIAALTTGFTGADLANLVNEAALVATRRDAEEIVLNDFTLAIERIVAGLEKKSRILNDFERTVVAHHEMGHAIVGMLLKSSEEIHKVSIIPRGIGALGYTIQRPTEDRFLMKREELENKICVLLGGRVAEKLIFDHLSTGASDDIAKCTDIARNMVTRYGMCEKLGHVSYESETNSFLGGPGIKSHDYSEETARDIDLAIKEIVDRCYQKTTEIITKNLITLKRSATLLLEKETLDTQELALIKKDLL
jgi:cell division protease FtsH